jgi:hypothetical protein
VLTWSVNCKRPQLPFSFGDSSVVAKHPRLGTHPDIPVAPLTGRSSYPSFNIIERQLPAKNAPTSCLFSIPSAHFQKSAYLIENKGKLPFCKSFDFSLFRTSFRSFPGSPLVSSFYQLHTGVWVPLRLSPVFPSPDREFPTLIEASLKCPALRAATIPTTMRAGATSNAVLAYSAAVLTRTPRRAMFSPQRISIQVLAGFSAAIKRDWFRRADGFRLSTSTFWRSVTKDLTR